MSLQWCFCCDSETTYFQHVVPLFLFINSGITQSVFINERCEVSVLKNNKRETGRVRNREGVTAGGGVCMCV